MRRLDDDPRAAGAAEPPARPNAARCDPRAPPFPGGAEVLIQTLERAADRLQQLLDEKSAELDRFNRGV